LSHFTFFRLNKRWFFSECRKAR